MLTAFAAEQLPETANDAGSPTHTSTLQGSGDLEAPLIYRGDRTGFRTAIDDAIETAQTVVKHTPLDHQYRPERLHNLALQLGQRYMEYGADEDLQDALSLAREAVRLTSTASNYPNRANILNHLGGLPHRELSTLEFAGGP